MFLLFALINRTDPQIKKVDTFVKSIVQFNVTVLL
jgi:hypothetical protein